MPGKSIDLMEYLRAAHGHAHIQKPQYHFRQLRFLDVLLKIAMTRYLIQSLLPIVIGDYKYAAFIQTARSLVSEIRTEIEHWHKIVGGLL